MHYLFKLRDVSDRAPNLSRATSDVPEPFPYLATGTGERPLPEARRVGPAVWWLIRDWQHALPLRSRPCWEQACWPISGGSLPSRH